MKQRTPFQTRKTLLKTQVQIDHLMALLPNLPLDEKKPLQVVIQEEEKPRKLSQNDLMWAGPLRDIAEQAWYQGRQFSADLWHELFKIMYLPEDDDPDLEELVMKGYRKWDYLPNGNRVCVGSTTKLKVKGMAQYITQIEAHGADLGVQFRAIPNEQRAA